MLVDSRRLGVRRTLVRAVAPIAGLSLLLGACTPQTHFVPPLPCVETNCPRNAACQDSACVLCASPAFPVDAGGVPLPSELTFVISSVDFGNSADDTPQPGFNLDHEYGEPDGGGCNQSDYTSLRDPDQDRDACADSILNCHAGVDNQVVGALSLLSTATYGWFSTNWARALASAYSDGRSIILLRVSGVGDSLSDPDVEIAMFMGLDADSDCANNVSGSGRFLLDTRSFVGGDPARPRWHAHGEIVAGRVRTTEPMSAPAFLPVWDRLEPVEVSQSQVRFELPHCGHTADRGNFGGWIPGQTILDRFAAVRPCSIDQSFRYYLGAVCDIPIDGTCATSPPDPPRYGGMSIGWSFQAVAANIVGVADSAPEGACEPLGVVGHAQPWDCGVDP